MLQFVSGSVSYSEATEERKKTVSHTRTEKKKRKREGMTKGLEDLKRKNSMTGACKKKKTVSFRCT